MSRRFGWWANWWAGGRRGLGREPKSGRREAWVVDARSRRGIKRSATPLQKHVTDQGTGDESESTKARAGRAWTTAQGQSKRRARRGGARTERGLRASQHRHRRAHRWRDRCSRSGGGGGSGGDGRRIARR